MISDHDLVWLCIFAAIGWTLVVVLVIAHIIRDGNQAEQVLYKDLWRPAYEEVMRLKHKLSAIRAVLDAKEDAEPIEPEAEEDEE